MARTRGPLEQTTCPVAIGERREAQPIKRDRSEPAKRCGFGESYVLHPFNRRVRNIVWAIQACHRDRPDDDCRKLLLKIFEVTALRWVYKPMTGSKDLTVEEIADLIEGQPPL